MTYIQECLFAQRDDTFLAFNAKLIPNIDKECVIGVKIPAVRQLAKRLLADESVQCELQEFMCDLPHKYLEENILHAELISSQRDFEKVLAETQKFLPYIDNWAVTDTFNPKVFAKHKTELKDVVMMWLSSEQEYTVRFAIVNAMRYFLDDFDKEMFDKIISIRSDCYYINMAIAWYMSVALVNDWGIALEVLKGDALGKWVHNKSIQKGIESFRLTQEQKTLLKTLKR